MKPVSTHQPKAAVSGSVVIRRSHRNSCVMRLIVTYHMNDSDVIPAIGCISRGAYNRVRLTSTSLLSCFGHTKKGYGHWRRFFAHPIGPRLSAFHAVITSSLRQSPPSPGLATPLAKSCRHSSAYVATASRQLGHDPNIWTFMYTTNFETALNVYCTCGS
jgi:hypothetical protein